MGVQVRRRPPEQLLEAGQLPLQLDAAGPRLELQLAVLARQRHV